ncbi:aspartic peptidase domain-containing protein [Xylaria nigripes]|nr:aspartic peptidase domain-containing protein [Xylaria nigripes]
MFGVFSCCLRFLFWISTLCALVLAAPELQREATSLDIDPSSQGFVTFSLIKKATVSIAEPSIWHSLLTTCHAQSGKFRTNNPIRSPNGVSRHAYGGVAIANREAGYRVVKAQDPQAKHSAGIDQDGADYSYFAEVSVGSEGKHLYMLLDTGASTTWVMGSSCVSKSCLIHNKFGPNDSKTYNDTGKPYNVEYGTGSVRGSIVEDTLSLAGLSITFPFGVANTTSDQFTQFPFDGILGLSISSDNWLSTVRNAQLIDANIFGVSLARSSDNINDGEITFGATNPDKYTGSITYTPIKPGSAWTIPMDDATVDGNPVGLHGKSAYIDTGTSFVFGPPADVAALYRLIPGSSSTDGATYSIPCNTDSKVAFTFSGKSWTVSSKDFVSAPNSDGVCIGSIYGIEYIAGGWLLGDVFLKNVYSVFDVDNQQIGFAAKAVPETTVPSTTITTSPTGTSTAGGLSQSTVMVSVPSVGATGWNGQESPSATSKPAAQPTNKDSSGDKLSAGRSIAFLASLLSMTALII